MVDKLDLFQLQEISVRNQRVEAGKFRKTNILVEAMHRGFMKMVEFIFSEGYTNIRAILKKNNNLEIENEVASFNVSFFITHMTPTSSSSRSSTTTSSTLCSSPTS